ncbi:MAG TPA: hypothetical protein VGM39_20610 [Kofleriaceae bacterium]|jgi:hypothetical protein
MIDSDRPAPRAPEGLRSKVIGAVLLGLVAITLAFGVVAWVWVRGSGTPAAAARPSPLVDDLFERTRETAPHGLHLTRAEWVDRAAGVAAIPIEQAIDAAALDPTLIGGRAR